MTLDAQISPDGELWTGAVELAGTQLRVRVQGAGPPLLLMAGIAGNLETWEPLADLLPGRRLIMFDAPGAGSSPLLPKGTRMHDVARVAAQLLDRLGVVRVDVLGYSWGGALAQQSARDHPERVRKLILAGTLPGLGGLQNPARPFQLHALSKARDARTRRARTAQLVRGRSGRDPAALANYERLRALAPGTLAGRKHQMRTILGWSSLAWLRTLRMPTLVLAGSEDPMAPSVNARVFKALMPDCRAHVVPGAGHLFLVDQPETVGHLIDDFLARDSTAATMS